MSPSRSRSRSRSPSRERSRSRTKSRSRSRSRSRTPPRRRSRSPRRSPGRGGSRTRYSRDNPPPSKCLGVFNLSTYTTERDLKNIFGEFGEIDRVDLVYDRPSGRSRGFGFVYFFSEKDAGYAREKMIDADIDGHKIRVDYSITKRAHSPTPGQYMGPGGGRHGYGGGGRRPKRESYRDGYSSRRRSISPRRSPRRRSRSRSYD